MYMASLNQTYDDMNQHLTTAKSLYSSSHPDIDERRSRPDGPYTSL